jgi:acetyltransferase EpsM
MELAVIGEGGHSKVVSDLIRSRKDHVIKAILDDKYEELTLHHGVYKGPISSAHTLMVQMDQLRFVVAIGNNEVRKSIVSRLAMSPAQYAPALIHETAVVSPSAFVGRGSVVMAHSTIHADSYVGNHAIINTGAIVEHDNRIGDYVHIAPRATLTGAVMVREGALIGAGATVIPSQSIGEWAIIGAGATVIRDIPSEQTAVGTPAKVITKRMLA